MAPCRTLHRHGLIFTALGVYRDIGCVGVYDRALPFSPLEVCGRGLEGLVERWRALDFKEGVGCIAAWILDLAVPA